jgi:hypothetical protein
VRHRRQHRKDRREHRLVNRDQIGHMSAANGELHCSLIFCPRSGTSFNEPDPYHDMALPLGAAGIAGGGPPAEPGGPPAAPAPPALPAQPKTYRELVSAASNSPARDHLTHYLQGYRFTDGGAGPVPAPASLRDQTVVLSDRQPMAFLCLTGTVVHRLMKKVQNV